MRAGLCLSISSLLFTLVAVLQDEAKEQQLIAEGKLKSAPLMDVIAQERQLAKDALAKLNASRGPGKKKRSVLEEYDLDGS